MSLSVLTSSDGLTEELTAVLPLLTAFFFTRLGFLLAQDVLSWSSMSLKDSCDRTGAGEACSNEWLEDDGCTSASV